MVRVLPENVTWDESSASMLMLVPLERTPSELAPPTANSMSPLPANTDSSKFRTMSAPTPTEPGSAEIELLISSGAELSPPELPPAAKELPAASSAGPVVNRGPVVLSKPGNAVPSVSSIAPAAITTK